MLDVAKVNFPPEYQERGSDVSDLKIAQRAIASKWIEAYQNYVSPKLPVPKPTPVHDSDVAETSGQALVNTKSTPH